MMIVTMVEQNKIDSQTDKKRNVAAHIEVTMERHQRLCIDLRWHPSDKTMDVISANTNRFKVKRALNPQLNQLLRVALTWAKLMQPT